MENKSSVEQNNFTQLCVWQGVVLNESGSEGFVNFMKKEFNARIKFECEVKTNPDIDKDGNPIKETGNRNDLFFYVHNDDISHFAIPRLKVGIRWWEDVVGYNNNSYLYPKEILDKYPLTW